MKQPEKQPMAFLLRKSLDDMHAESMAWLSEIDFWDVELNFFQKLLTKSYQISEDKYDDSVVEGLEGKLIAFNKEAVASLKEKITKHEKYLSGLFDNVPKHNDEAYIEEHLAIEKDIHAMEKKFKAFKRELFSFVEEKMLTGKEIRIK